MPAWEVLAAALLQITLPFLHFAYGSLLQGRWRSLAKSSKPSSSISAAGWQLAYLESLSEWKLSSPKGKDASRRSKTGSR